MKTAAKQYEIAVTHAIEVSQAILDMEGGRYTLAMFSELLQELLKKGNVSGATSVVQKLHKAAEVPFEQIIPVIDNTGTWFLLFSEALGDILEDGFSN